ncbi:hypothetical protein GN958_ATG20772, partial [Phytophthora infestans]
IDDWRQRRRKFYRRPHDRLNTVVATGKADDGSVWRGSNSGKSAATIATPGLDRVWPADDASLSSRGCSAGAAGAGTDDATPEGERSEATGIPRTSLSDANSWSATNADLNIDRYDDCRRGVGRPPDPELEPNGESVAYFAVLSQGGRRAIASTSTSSLVTVASSDEDTSKLWHDTAPAISSTISRSVSSLMPGMAVLGMKSWLMTADDAW